MITNGLTLLFYIFITMIMAIFEPLTWVYFASSFTTFCMLEILNAVFKKK